MFHMDDINGKFLEYLLLEINAHYFDQNSHFIFRTNRKNTRCHNLCLKWTLLRLLLPKRLNRKKYFRLHFQHLFSFFHFNNLCCKRLFCNWTVTNILFESLHLFPFNHISTNYILSVINLEKNTNNAWITNYECGMWSWNAALHYVNFPFVEIKRIKNITVSSSIYFVNTKFNSWNSMCIST